MPHHGVFVLKMISKSYATTVEMNVHDEKSKRGKQRKGQDCTTVWIQCDNCAWWYHITTCVGKPDTKKPYSCLACI
ncbi:hypothetical protein MHYP_G00216710 [Metynnis hypsauchen]